MDGNKLKIGSRGSQLALWQANHIKDRLTGQYPGLAVELKIIKTLGDKVQDVALAKVGGKGLFTKEIEEAILAGKVDLAVHSLKDLPTELPSGLIAGIITRRTHGSDALISRDNVPLKLLPAGSRVGTSSLRRKVQLRDLRPDLHFLDLRGNVDTRLKKLDRGEYEAIVLAQAGLVRLGLESRITELFTPRQMVPAAGQGALALEYREGDSRTAELLRFLQDPDTALEVEAERDFLHELGGGCQVPIGVRAVLKEDGRLELEAMISDLHGTHLMRDSLTGHPGKKPGKILAGRMLEAGGRAILEEILGAE